METGEIQDGLIFTSNARAGVIFHQQQQKAKGSASSKQMLQVHRETFNCETRAEKQGWGCESL